MILYLEKGKVWYGFGVKITPSRDVFNPLPTNCLSVFGSFVGLALKGLRPRQKPTTEIFCKKKREKI